MKVFIKSIEGKIIPLNVEPQEKIKEIIEKITKELGFSKDNQILSYSGKILKNQDSIGDLINLQKGSIINLDLKLKGGCGASC